MTDETSQKNEVLTKDTFRLRIWEELVKEKLIRHPHVIEMNHILRFEKAAKTADQLSQLDIFKNANLVYIHKSARPVVYRVLKAGKEIVVPMHSDKSCQFWHLQRTTDIPLQRLKALSAYPIRKEPGEVLDITTNIKIDLVILGSICVSKDGRRIGDGKGLVDLEFAVLKRMGAITDETTVVTTVHDIQVLDTLSSELFQKHDVPVDIIVTHSEVIFVNPRLEKPANVVWQMLSEREVEASQLLQQLKQMDKENGIDVTSNVVEPTVVSVRSKRKTRQRRRQNESQIEDNRLPNAVQAAVSTENRKVSKNSRNSRSSPKKQIDFSLKLSNIAKNVTRRDLKNALLERDVKPDQIKWLNRSNKRPSFCYIRFSKLRDENAPREEPVQVDSIMAKLHQLKVGKTSENEADFIIVEPANPISRIEVTDVTTF